MYKKRIISITLGLIVILISSCIAITKDNLSGMSAYIDEDQNRRYEILTAQVKDKEVTDITVKESWTEYISSNLIYKNVSLAGEITNKVGDSFIVVNGNEKEGFMYYEIKTKDDNYKIGDNIKAKGRVYGEKSSNDLYPILISHIELK